MEGPTRLKIVRCYPCRCLYVNTVGQHRCKKLGEIEIDAYGNTPDECPHLVAAEEAAKAKEHMPPANAAPRNGSIWWGPNGAPEKAKETTRAKPSRKSPSS